MRPPSKSATPHPLLATSGGESTPIGEALSGFGRGLFGVAVDACKERGLYEWLVRGLWAVGAVAVTAWWCSGRGGGGLHSYPVPPARVFCWCVVQGLARYEERGDAFPGHDVRCCRESFCCVLVVSAARLGYGCSVRTRRR